MANENDNDEGLVVNIDDLDTVQVNVDDDLRLAQEPEHIKKEAEAKKKEPRTRKSVEQQAIPVGPTPEEVIEQTKTYAKQQEDARKAAEATAASERAMREQAQRETQQAQQTAEQFRERADNSELAVIENGIQAATQQIESLESEYTRAAEAGEFAKMGNIQTKLSRAAAALDRLENSKANFSGKVTQTHEGRVTEPTATQQPLDRYMAQFTPVAQNWLRQHPECWPPELGGTAAKNSKMLAGHYDAVSQNIILNSPEYFKVIEGHLNPPQAKPEPVIDPKVASKASETIQAGETVRRTPPPAAPVSRDVPGQQPRNVREVRLTKEQQEAAKMSWPNKPELEAYGLYARNLIELEAEGKMGRLTH